MPKTDKPIDWDGIEADYRAGIMSVREIARWYKVTEGAIRKRAKKDGWERKQKPPHIERPVLTGDVLPPPAVKPEDVVDRARGMTARLLDELETVTSHVGELEDMICEEESDPRRRQALLKALSLSERAMTMKNIATTMKTLNEAAVPEGGKKAERQANADRAAGSGKFGVPSAPRMVVDNTK